MKARFETFYEDSELLVLNKPSGLLCQPGKDPSLFDSLITRLRQDYAWAELVHRLDRDTSGIIVIALNPQSHRQLSRAFEQRQVEKRYIGITHGQISGIQGVLVSPLAKIGDNPPRYGIHSEGRMAVTYWELMAREGEHSRLALYPITGRSHQLRVQCAAIGHSLLGDPIYSGATEGRLCLHAETLVLPHPGTGERLRFTCPTPF